MSETTTETSTTDAAAETSGDSATEAPAPEAASTEGESALGDAGKKALDAMKAKWKEADQARKALEADFAAFKARADGKEAEFTAAQDAQRVKDEALAAANKRIVAQNGYQQLHRDHLVGRAPRAVQVGAVPHPGLNHQYEGELASGNTVKITAITTPSIQNYATARTLTIDALTDTTQSPGHQQGGRDLVQGRRRRPRPGGRLVRARHPRRREGPRRERRAEPARRPQGERHLGRHRRDHHGRARLRGRRLDPSGARQGQGSVLGPLLAVSPEFAALLLGESSKLTSFDPVGDEPIRNGVIGRMLGFTVVEHPLLTHTSNRPCAVGLHGRRSATSARSPRSRPVAWSWRSPTTCAR
jgi:hypothetical protein